MSKLIAITIGHAGHPDSWGDRGACCVALEEVSIIREYVDALDKELRRLGYNVVILSDGSYSDQWKRADDYGADLYLNCHSNSGGGNHGLVLFDYRSKVGPGLAMVLAQMLEAAVYWECHSRSCHPDDDGQPRDEDYTEAWNCIAGVKAVAVTVEPYFIDGPQVAWYLAHLWNVGKGLAKGIDSWFKANG